MNPSLTRRHALVGMAAALAATTQTRAQAQQPAMDEKPATAANQARSSIHYEIDFKPSPQRLYQAILDPKQFAAFSGLPAMIDPTPGGAFSMFGGLIVGRNIEFVSGSRIVQAWRPTHWTPGVYSIVHFEFTARATETTLIFDHTGFPAGDYDSLDSGWHSHYWEPLKKFFALP
jgi:activator of HSP90 ATPase